MMIAERIQALVHKLDVEGGPRRLNYLALTLAVVGLAVWYDTHCYRNFIAPEAMDAAQVARNLAAGNGFTTEFIRPFSVYLLQKHNRSEAADQSAGKPAFDTNVVDHARVYGRHPDLANAPLYPLVLAGLFKVFEPYSDLSNPHLGSWHTSSKNGISLPEGGGSFWFEGGRFTRYPPEFFIAIFNQMLLLAAVLLTFLVARTIFDTPAAWLAALLTLFSDVLWKFSVSGLPTLLLLVIFLGLVWCLASFEAMGRGGNVEPNSAPRRWFVLAVSAGLLTALGMLTRYSFGWLIVPVVTYFAVFGGGRRIGLAVAAFLAFAAAVAPWIIRNMAVSGTWFGTAGYAVAEGIFTFPESRLIRSLTPDMTSAYWVLPYLVKLQVNLHDVLQGDLLRLGGGWMIILFLAGLLLGLRNPVARRLRYFTMMCLGVFLIVTPLGRTPWSVISPELNTENPLVLLTPLVFVFGVAFFLTLLNQMNAPSNEVRYGVVGLVVVLACQPFIMTLLPPKSSPTSFPPYYPPEIQKLSGWLGPDELMMSDIPWAVAWYGNRKCTWLTINSQYEFFQFYDYVKPVDALYLTFNTLNSKLFTECLQGPVDSWGSFVFERIGAEKIKVPNEVERWGNIVFRNMAPNRGPRQFPLNVAPSGLISGLLLADHQRW